MPEATDKIAAAGGDCNTSRRALHDLEDPMRALNAASSVLALVAAGIAARRQDYAFAPWEGEALDYLAEHIGDLAANASRIVETGLSARGGAA